MPSSYYLISHDTAQLLADTVKSAYNISTPISINGIINTISEKTNAQELTLNSYIDRTLSGNITLTAEGVGDFAFYGFSLLEQVSLPNTSFIGQSAFKGCSSLTTFYAPNCTTCNSSFEDKTIKKLTLGITDTIVSDKNNNHPIFYSDNIIEEINFPKITTIGTKAFTNCINLKSVDFEQATTFNERAFQDCSSLLSIYLPKATNINGNCFKSCSNLTTVLLPEFTVTGAEAFYDCLSLKTFYAPKLTALGNNMFLNDKSLESLTFGFETMSALFSKYTTLKYVSLSNAKTISRQAFLNCTSLSEIIIPKVTTIEDSAFEGCITLPTLNLDSITSIGSSAFKNCTILRKIDAPLLTTINSKAFEECHNLDWFNCNFSQVQTIKDNAFMNCSALTTVDAKQCNSLGVTPFLGCTNLTYGQFGQLSEIAENRLNGTNIETVDLPNCTKIKTKAFISCNNLQQIYLPEVITIENNAFENCNNLQSIILPKCTNISANAFLSCSNLTKVYLLHPSSVATITSTTFPAQNISFYVNNNIFSDYKANSSWNFAGDNIYGINCSTKDFYIRDIIDNRICFSRFVIQGNENLASLNIVDSMSLYLMSPYVSSTFTLAQNITADTFNSAIHYIKTENYISTKTYDTALTYYTKSGSTFIANTTLPNINNFLKDEYYIKRDNYILSTVFSTDTSYYTCTETILSDKIGNRSKFRLILDNNKVAFEGSCFKYNFENDTFSTVSNYKRYLYYSTNVDFNNNANHITSLDQILKTDDYQLGDYYYWIK